MLWYPSHQSDPPALELADRHYSRTVRGSAQLGPPGTKITLLTAGNDALWQSVWPKYPQHHWGDCWLCTYFRNESTAIASQLIRDAMAVTRHHWGEVRPFLTFVNPRKVRPTRVRGRDVWGWVFLKAGYQPCGKTARGLLAFKCLEKYLPEPEPSCSR